MTNRGAYPHYDIVREQIALQNRVKRVETTAKGSDWYNYSIAWTSSGTAPALNSTIVNSRYQRIGRTCNVIIDVTFDGTTSFGTGTYSWSLPFTTSAWSGAVGQMHLLTSGGTRVGGQAVLPNNSSTFSVFVPISGSAHLMTAMTNTVPVTLGNGDRIRMNVSYEVLEGT